MDTIYTYRKSPYTVMILAYNIDNEKEKIFAACNYNLLSLPYYHYCNLHLSVHVYFERNCLLTALILLIFSCYNNKNRFLVKFKFNRAVDISVRHNHNSSHFCNYLQCARMWYALHRIEFIALFTPLGFQETCSKCAHYLCQTEFIKTQ